MTARTTTILALVVLAVAQFGAATGHARTRLPWMPFAPQQPHPAVVRITAVEDKAVSQGSGTLVAVRGQQALVVTNWHVVRDATGEIRVVFPDGFRSAARVLKVDSEWDLAALLIWRPDAIPVPISSVAPRPGDTLTIAGYGQGQYRAATGRCTQYVAPGTNMPYEMVEVSAEARQGDSGGPILNERGELAGVLFGAAGGTTSGSFCGRVRWFLESAWPGLGEDVAWETGARRIDADETAPPIRVPPDDPVEQFHRMTPLDPPAPDLAAGQSIALTAAPVAASPARPQVSLDPIAPGPSPSTTQLPSPWTQVVGDRPWDLAKSVLALVGLLAIAHQLTRGGT